MDLHTEPDRQGTLSLSLLKRFMSEEELDSFIANYFKATMGPNRQFKMEIVTRFMNGPDLDEFIGAYRATREKYGRAISAPSAELISVIEAFLRGERTYIETTREAARITGNKSGAYQVERAMKYLAKQGRLTVKNPPVPVEVVVEPPQHQEA